MKHHRREGNPQGDRGLLTVQNTGIAVPAFLRVLNLRNLFSACGPKDIRGANIGTNPTGITFLLIKDGWHNNSFLNEPSRYPLRLCTMRLSSTHGSRKPQSKLREDHDQRGCDKDRDNHYACSPVDRDEVNIAQSR